MNDTRRVVLGETNIAEVVDHPEEYRGRTLLIDGRAVRDGRRSFTVAVEYLLAMSRHLPCSVVVEFPELSTRRIRNMVQ